LSAADRQDRRRQLTYQGGDPFTAPQAPASE
jgi:hypothetical protein